MGSFRSVGVNGLKIPQRDSLRSPLTPPSLQLICWLSKANKPSIFKDPKSGLSIRLISGIRCPLLTV